MACLSASTSGRRRDPAVQMPNTPSTLAPGNRPTSASSRLCLVATIASYNSDAKEGRDPEFGRGSTIYQRHLGDSSHKPNPCVAPIVTCAVLRDAHLPGRSRHRHRHEGRRPGARAARGRHADRGALRLRQRHGLDHERELSGPGHHAGAGADVRVYRGTASGGGSVAADAERREGSLFDYRPRYIHDSVIASAAKQSRLSPRRDSGLLRRKGSSQ